jgi:hypothetical protein
VQAERGGGANGKNDRQATSRRRVSKKSARSSAHQKRAS